MAELPEGTRLVYANWARYIAAPFDLSLDLGYNTQPGPPGTWPVRVAMSWEHAKILAGLLNEAVAAYEEKAGAIRSLQGEVESEEEDMP